MTTVRPRFASPAQRVGFGPRASRALLMTSDTYIPAAIVLAIIVGAVVAAPIGFISFQIGRRSARKTGGQDITLERRPPKVSESLLSELQNLRCLVTGIARDADALSSVADRSSGRLPAELHSALAQLL